jgi:phage portal protein BeeE
MGPYSEQRQLERAQAIARLLENPDLNADARRIWKNHLRNLCRNEETYNYRVRTIWTEIRNRQTKGWLE